MDLIDSGRVLVFGTPLTRLDPENTNSPLILKMDTLADLSIKGLFSGHFFGYAISEAGDIDVGGGDGVSEFLVGAPAFGGAQFGVENFGRVYLYTFPDRINPWIDINYISPQENQNPVPKFALEDGVTKSLKIRFLVNDDRAVRYSAVYGSYQGVLIPPFDPGVPSYGPTINFKFDDLTSSTNYVTIENRRKVMFYIRTDATKLRYNENMLLW